MKLKDKPIYPNSKLARDGDLKYIQTTKGITLLEHYAGLAMQGFLANSRLPQDKPHLYVAKESITYAKALIKELENEGH